MTSFLPNIVLSFNDCWCRRGFALDPQVVRLYGRLSQSLWNISYILDHQRFYWVAEPAACQICRLFPLHQEGLCNFLFVYFWERKSSKTLSFMLYHNLFFTRCWTVCLRAISSWRRSGTYPALSTVSTSGSARSSSTRRTSPKEHIDRKCHT